MLVFTWLSQPSALQKRETAIEVSVGQSSRVEVGVDGCFPGLLLFLFLFLLKNRQQQQQQQRVENGNDSHRYQQLGGVDSLFHLPPPKKKNKTPRNQSRRYAKQWSAIALSVLFCFALVKPPEEKKQHTSPSERRRDSSTTTPQYRLSISTTFIIFHAKSAQGEEGAPI